MKYFDDIREKYPNLKASQIKAAYLLSKGKKQSVVARDIEIGATTMWKWKQRDDFQALYKEFCDLELMNIGGLYHKATNKLNDLLDKEDIRDQDLLNAIKLMQGEYHKLMDRMEKISPEKEDKQADALDRLADILESK